MRGQPAIEYGRMPKHDGICPASGKRMFRTRSKALKAPQSIGKSKTVYRCEHCGSWHTSSMDKSEVAQMEARRRKEKR